MDGFLDRNTGFLPPNSSGVGSGVASVAAADGTITIAGTATDPTFAVGTLTPGANGVPLSGIDLIYGRGQSGAVSASTASLAANVYATTYTVGNGITVTVAGFKIVCTTSANIQAGGVVNADGAAGAAGGTAGSSASASAVGGGAASGAGGTAGGSNASNGTSALGGSGGAGGSGSGGAGGTAGTASPPTAANGTSLMDAWSAAMGHIISGNACTRFSGGAGGGGGGGDGTAGGGGGGAGGIVIIVAPTITVAGTVRANGGAGGSPAAGNRGGGGGGGGGAVILVANTFNISGTVQATAGAKGNLSGTGTDGTAGSAGNTFQITV